MKTKTLDGRPLVEMLQAEKSGYENMVRLLGREWGCLKIRDIAGLVALTRLKEDQVRELQSARTNIQAWPAAVGREPGRPQPGLTGRAGAKAAELQQTIGGLQKEVHSLNDRNKRYIEETLRIVEHFFSLLALPEEKAPVYMRYENGRASAGVRSLISRRL
jgi:hypothetical protein